VIVCEGTIPDLELWRLARWPDRLVHAWWRRLLRATWARGQRWDDVALERLAGRVVASLRYFRDRLARRMPWAVRVARCGSRRVALRSLAQAIRGVSC